MSENQSKNGSNKNNRRRGNTRRRQGSDVPASVRHAVKDRYDGLVKVVAKRGRGYAVRIPGELRGVTSAMFADEAGFVYFDSTSPSVRKRELAAAARLEEKGYTQKADEIRRRVAPELLIDATAVRSITSTARVLGAVREVLTTTGVRSTWHRPYGRGDDYAPLTLDIGRGRRLRAGNIITDEGEETPWYALDEGSRHGERTENLGAVLASV